MSSTERTDWNAIVRPLGFPAVEQVDRLIAGRNSRVHHLQAGGQHVVVKQYYAEGVEPSARQQREFDALRFLWDCSVCSIPEPLLNDFQQRALVLAFVPGTSAATTSISEADTIAAADFLLELRLTASRPGAETLVDATDAAFCLSALINGIEARIDRLSSEARAPVHLENSFQALLGEELASAFARAAGQARTNLSDQTLAFNARTLSPSDFGFHNAIRTHDGGLVFLDFEHFGWDDPAKTIADFVLHPGMAIAPALRTLFATSMLQRFTQFDLALAERTSHLGPLYAVKWATILLNEFLPSAAARRRFAGVDTRRDDAVLEEQIDKARRMLIHTDDFKALAGL